MSIEELKQVYGGLSFSATLLNSIIKGVTALYEIGRRVGSYFIRYKTNNLCSADEN